MDKLKERECKILNYMKEEIRTKGYPPTVREICAAVGIKSTSTAHKDIESLVRQGYLVKDPSKPRALMVVDLVSRQYDKAMTILRENREKLDQLASFLYEKETITGEEFMAILESGSEQK